MPSNKTTTEEWKTCCRKEIIKLWVESGSMDIVHYQGECPECKHFIGLTQTPEEEAREFIERTISSAKQEEVQRIIELAEKMKSKDYYSPNFLTRITQGEMEDHLLINDLITTLKDYGK